MTANTSAVTNPVVDGVPTFVREVAASDISVLILGASGSGKSGLALRMMALGAGLIADDRVMIGIRDGRLEAWAPEPIAGLIEARGVGLLRAPAEAAAEVVLAVDLDRAPAARMPQCGRITYLGRNVRLISGRDVPNLDAILTILLDNFQPGPA